MKEHLEPEAASERFRRIEYDAVSPSFSSQNVFPGLTSGLSPLQAKYYQSDRAIQLRHLHEVANSSPRVLQLRIIQEKADAYVARHFPFWAPQPVAINDDPFLEKEADEKGAEALSAGTQVTQRKEDTSRTYDRTPAADSQNSDSTETGGLPYPLKAGIEILSGLPMHDVRVHYNSEKPAQLQAHAYAQGNDIHVASGQEQHLPHEAWHVVQQKLGRVKPTTQTGDQGSTTNARQRQLLGPTPSFAGPVAQLTTAELNSANTKWTAYDANHAVVNGLVTGDVAALQAAYAHYASPAGGNLTDAQADANNPFLEKSVKSLLHDVEEIDSHAGGYYFQQMVKDAKNTALGGLDVQAQQGAHGGVSNTTDPDIAAQAGPAAAKEAIEVKRTTTANGAATLLDGALSQLSRRTGYRDAAVAMEVTNPTQVADITGNRGAVDSRITNHLGTLEQAFGSNYWPHATPGGLGLRHFTLTVRIQSAVPGAAVADIYDRDFTVNIDQTVGARRTRYSLIVGLTTTRV